MKYALAAEDPPRWHALGDGILEADPSVTSLCGRPGPWFSLSVRPGGVEGALPCEPCDRELARGAHHHPTGKP